MSSPAEAEPPARDGSRTVQRARRLEAAGQQARAIAVARRLVRRASGKPEPALLLAELLLPDTANDGAAAPADETRRSAREAREALAAAYRAHPDDRELRLALAWAIAVEGDHRASIEEAAGAAHALDTRTGDALRRLAALAIRRGDLAAADRALLLARRADPRDVDLRSDHATLALARGRTDQAVRLYRQALEARPGERRARRELAAALLARGDGDEALRLLVELADETPRRPEPQLDLARAALEARRFPRSVAAARRAHRLAEPDDPRAAVLLGLALQAHDRPDEAAFAFREALRRDPDHARARQALRALEGSAEALDAPTPRKPSPAQAAP